MGRACGADRLAQLLAAGPTGELERFLRRKGKRDALRCALLLPGEPVRPATASETADLEGVAAGPDASALRPSHAGLGSSTCCGSRVHVGSVA